MFRLLFGALGYQILWQGWSDFFIGEHVRKFKSMEFDLIKDVLASNLVAIQEALILGIRAPVRDSVHGLIDYQYFAQVQEREKYWGGTAREHEKGNSQQGREHFRWLLLRRSTAPDLADYASPRHAQRFRNYCGTVGLVNVDEFGRNVKCRREEWGKAFRALSRRSHDGDNTNGDLHKHGQTLSPLDWQTCASICADVCRPIAAQPLPRRPGNAPRRGMRGAGVANGQVGVTVEKRETYPIRQYRLRPEGWVLSDLEGGNARRDRRPFRLQDPYQWELAARLKVKPQLEGSGTQYIPNPVTLMTPGLRPLTGLLGLTDWKDLIAHQTFVNTSRFLHDDIRQVRFLVFGPDLTILQVGSRLVPCK
ncbi:hypothetical protein C8J57DRAFT_1249528 [Mycena rebaudengoi]|nr:hypothetical protein C8J57DRAFT_1249528 [Mycena rebaudengoi]